MQTGNRPGRVGSTAVRPWTGRLTAMLFTLVAALLLPAGCWDDDNSGPAPDTTPPATVANLSVASVTDSSATLLWEAPGDDGATGTASAYDIRSSTDSITVENWSTATQAADPPAPRDAGSAETFTFEGLATGTAYYFALKAVDDEDNWSALSNVATGTTTEEPPPDDPVLSVSPDSLDFSADLTNQTFTITNVGTGTLT